MKEKNNTIDQTILRCNLTQNTNADFNFSEEQKNKHIPMTFPLRLMEMLSNESHLNVVIWLPHGKAFIIYKKKKFALEVLPKYFKQSKFTSFTRKLNRWGFIRVTKGPDTGAYYHNYFQRGDIRLCMQMSCKSVTSLREVSLQNEAAVDHLSPIGIVNTAYVPQPNFPPQSMRILKLASEVQKNTQKIQQLTTSVVSVQTQLSPFTSLLNIPIAAHQCYSMNSTWDIESTVRALKEQTQNNSALIKLFQRQFGIDQIERKNSNDQSYKAKNSNATAA